MVVAYSGGLDMSVIRHWLKETSQCEVIALCADIGQEEELKGLDREAKATGASKFYALHLVEEFARDLIFPMIRAGAIYGTSIFSARASRARSSPARRTPRPWCTARRGRAATSAGSS